MRQTATVLLGLSLTVLLARTLGPHGNGLFALAILIPTLLATFFNLGIGSANVYFVGTGLVSVALARKVSVRVGAVASVAGLAVAFGVFQFGASARVSGLTEVELAIALVCFPLALFLQLLTSLLQAEGDFRRFNRVLLLGPTTTLGLVATAAVLIQLNVTLALIAYALGLLASVAIGWLAREQQEHDPLNAEHPSLPEGTYLRRALGYGWKAQLSNFLTLLMYRVDLLFVGHFLSPTSVGIYAVAAQIAERLWMPSQAVSTVLLPRLAQLHGSEDVRTRLTPVIARWTFALSAFAAVLLAIVAGPLVQVTLGDRFDSALLPLLLMLPGIAFAGAARVLASDLAARGRPELTLYVTAGALTANVVLNLLLIPAMGVPGAAVAASLTYILDTLLFAWLYARVAGTRVRDSLVVRREDLSLLISKRNAGKA